MACLGGIPTFVEKTTLVSVPGRSSPTSPVGTLRSWKMTVRTICRSAVLCLLLAGGTPVVASQLIPRTLPELASGADLVFVGRCEAVSPHWNDDHTLILTA